MLTIVSHVMEKLVARNEWLAKSLEAFHGVRPGLHAYIDRLAHNKHPSSLVVSLNVHGILVTFASTIY